ncbi:hypothetical protein Cri9333_5004 (plasmid) [Crinalium epipsammum PCC 9333]|uniref:Uncharacterized protein n=1 Tax=Crinalium epipsammum PCC 9333 TaxID=1173022 RepID=K9W7I0_9CYAN|nr:hypothetical protein [Crinalium epipsammum]AFZ15759.1 hypothetical protein Cri9333_5004 [Crinalium epipsammum PCC 9333]
MTKFSKVALVGLVTLAFSVLAGVSVGAEGFKNSLPLLFQAASATAVVSKNALDVIDNLERKEKGKEPKNGD